MAFDYKKEYKEFYMPPKKPTIVEVPEMNFLAVRGCGNPNEEGGAYQAAVGLLYAVAYTIKMSYKGEHKIDGFFEYVVPPLEGFWWQKDVQGVDYSNKDSFQWISVIRLPDFVSREDFDWAVRTAEAKKSWTSPVWNTSLTKRDLLSSVCISVLTTMSLRLWLPWRLLPSPRDMRLISEMSAIITRFISVIRENVIPLR